MTWLFSAPVQPFAIAALVLVGLVAIEIASTVAIGIAPSEMVDASALGDMLENALGWLNLGRVPFLVFLMVLLALFSSVGFVLQAVALDTIGALPNVIAVPASAVVAVVGARGVSRFVARVLPRDETYVVTDGDLVGLTGVVTVGPLEVSVVGRIRVVDRHGNRHFPRARPSLPSDIIEQGTVVLIVDQSGREYRVIRAPADLVDTRTSSV